MLNVLVRTQALCRIRKVLQSQRISDLERKLEDTIGTADMRIEELEGQVKQLADLVKDLLEGKKD